MQFDIIFKPGIQKKEENQEKNAEYIVRLHNTKNERESKLHQITEQKRKIYQITRWMNWGWKIFWSKKRDWKKWSFNKFKYSALTLLRNKATKCD